MSSSELDTFSYNVCENSQPFCGGSWPEEVVPQQTHSEGLLGEPDFLAEFVVFRSPGCPFHSLCMTVRGRASRKPPPPCRRLTDPFPGLSFQGCLNISPWKMETAPPSGKKAGMVMPLIKDSDPLSSASSAVMRPAGYICLGPTMLPLGGLGTRELMQTCCCTCCLLCLQPVFAFAGELQAGKHWL